MSASLVGSEMCIRDRLVPELKLTRGVHDLTGVPRYESCRAPVSPSTVSYTHLTLPTRCSV
eukprot:2288354-Alexandrium_andersonii.AAC.1